MGTPRVSGLRLDSWFHGFQGWVAHRGDASEAVLDGTAGGERLRLAPTSSPRVPQVFHGLTFDKCTWGAEQIWGNGLVGVVLSRRRGREIRGRANLSAQTRRNMQCRMFHARGPAGMLCRTREPPWDSRHGHWADLRRDGRRSRLSGCEAQCKQAPVIPPPGPFSSQLTLISERHENRPVTTDEYNSRPSAFFTPRMRHADQIRGNRHSHLASTPAPAPPFGSGLPFCQDEGCRAGTTNATQKGSPA